MDLALRGARADGTPTYQARQVLWDNHVEEFSSRWYPHFREVEKKTTGQPQTIIDFERPIEMRIVNQALPANACTGFLEIDPHNNPEIRGQFVYCGLEQCCIFACSLGVVNRARAHNDKQAMIFALENVADLHASLIDRGRGLVGHRHFFFEEDRRKNNSGPFDTNVVGSVEHWSLCSMSDETLSYLRKSHLGCWPQRGWKIEETQQPVGSQRQERRSARLPDEGYALITELNAAAAAKMRETA